MEARSLGIVGVGLIGGSIALAALRAGYGVYLYDRFALGKLAGARFEPAVVVGDLEELASHSRLIILATPIAALAEVGRGSGRTREIRSGSFRCGERKGTGYKSHREGLAKSM